MALVTPATLATEMGYAFQAQPFVNVPAKPSITLTNMEYAFQAQPFVGNYAPAAAPTIGGKSAHMASKLVAEGVI